MAKSNSTGKKPGKKKKVTLYSILNPDRDGKGVPKASFNPNAPRNLPLFFKMFWRNISNLFTLNMLLVLGNFPVLIFMLGLSGNFNRMVTSAAAVQYGAFYGLFKNMPLSPVSGALLGVYGIPTIKQVLTPVTYTLFALGGLVLFTFGPVRAGVTYVLRNIVRGEPLFLWKDFAYAIKRNWKQALVLGIIDVVSFLLLTFDLIFFLANTGTVLNNLLFSAIVVVYLYYVMMRFYVYIMIVTFDLKIIKVLKNALIFALVNIKRNIAAVIGIAAMLLFNYYLMLVFFPLGIMFPFIILFSGGAFMGIYAAWPKIKELMIDPLDEDKPAEPKEEPIFQDDIG